MLFHSTPLAGVYEIEASPHRDARGFFARLYCTREFTEAGIDFAPIQMNLSGNHTRGTLRGLHFQADPYAETKLVRCVKGACFDVAVDLRPASPSFRRWHGVRLDPARMNALLIPKGCAHGYLTLEDDTEILYQVDAPYHPGSDRGIRWDDPAIGIQWPEAPVILKPADSDWPLLA